MSSADTYSSAQSSVPSAASTNTSTSTPQQTNAEAPQSAANVAQSNVAGDGLKCEWASCGERLPNAEALYDHVCERHVGRKSTNNLNLTCAWGGCRTTTVKRDHITSHIRVHVPLKPHKCDFCQKAFKRPQDLKKHVKTHAEDSSFHASSDAGRSQHQGGTGVFAGGAKHVADLQHLAATAAGYYPDHHNIGVNPSYPPYPNGAAANPSAYHGPSGYHQANYMTALYPISPSSAMSSEYEVRKKATFDALNEFFGDIKTRSIDPGVYNAVGHRLMGLQNLTSYSGAHDFGGNTAVAAATHAPFANHYSLPMSNIRTKNDLQHIDQFLEQLQSTVYEHETQAAQAGVQQAGIHYQHAGLNLRTSNSPPHSGSSHHNYSSHHTLPPIASTASDTTPALTPASSVMSYNSPQSVHSATISPISRGSNASMYPTLPSVSSVSDAISGAIPSALASSFDDSRRRFSSGHLHRGRETRESSEATELPAIDRLGVRSPSLSKVDPALEGKEEKSAQSPSSPKEKDEKSKPEDPDWIVKIRTLEAIRTLIKQRLDNNVFEEDEDAATIKPEAASPKAEGETEEEKEARSLYPVLRAVQEA